MILLYCEKLLQVVLKRPFVLKRVQATRTSLHLLLTYSMVQSPSWEANWFAASQEIPRISRNLKVHYRTHKRPPLHLLFHLISVYQKKKNKFTVRKQDNLMVDLRLSQRCCWRIKSFGIRCRVAWKSSSRCSNGSLCIHLQGHVVQEEWFAAILRKVGD